MKIGILTYQRTVNYGAYLQGWSLPTLLQAHGAQVEMIDYQPAHRRRKALSLNLRRPFSAANIMALRRQWLFRDYVEKKLPMGKRQFRSYQELESAHWDHDAIVLGSDQIWNPLHIGHLDPAYFAWFAPDHVRRVAYAASTGMADMPQAFVEDYCKYAGRLDYIGLRESNLVAFTEALLCRPCYHVLDPTLLGVDFSTIEEPISAPSRYVFTYALQLSDTMKKAVRTSANKLGIPALTVKTKVGNHEYAEHHRTPNPGQWLTLMKNAEMVLTNSFHGVAFCLIYQRPFAVVPYEGEASIKMARIVDLLEQVGLSQHMLPQGDAGAVEKLVGLPIDWPLVSQRLNRLRASSLLYLAEALNMPSLCPAREKEANAIGGEMPA